MKNFLSASLFGILMFVGLSSSAQLINGQGFLMGNVAEIGVAGPGGYEGADTTLGMPAGHHWRSDPFNLLFGFVADPNVTGWTNYDGDFFTPGSPENGWGLEVGYNMGGINNNCSGSQADISGAITNWQQILDCIQVDWSGGYVGSGYDLSVDISYKLNVNDPYYITEVTITNNGATMIDSLFYLRNVDPDNNETLSFDYTTQNTIVSQPVPGCEKALVSATQATPWNSYMGFGAIGPNFRVGYGGFSNRDASAAYYGTGWGFVQAVGSTNFADEAIYLTNLIYQLAPGASETFEFVVILDAAQVDAALGQLFYLDYSGGLGGPPPACVTTADTAYTCPGVPVTIEVDGAAVGDFNWTWTPGTGLSTTTGPITDAAPMTTTTYTVTGTPINPCYTGNIVKEIVVVVSAPMDLVIDLVDPSCGMTDGSVEVTAVNGGVSPYTYQWTGGPGSPMWNTLGAGSYTITVTDDAGCIVDSTVTLMNAGGLAGNTVSVTDASCGAANGALEVAGTGGTTPYTYDIGGGPQASGVFTGLIAGTYTVTITDAGGCTYDVVVVVNDLSGLGASVTAQTDASCNGLLDGDVTITATGGTTPYTYDIGGGPQASGLFTGLGQGSYTVTVTDGAGCILTVPVTIGEPAPIVPAIDVVTDALCAGSADGTIDASATGGTAPFTFDIGGGPQASGLFNGLGMGSYTITFTDANGCSATLDTVIAEPTPLSINFSAFDAVCNGACDGYGVVIPSGGTSPYTYNWSSGGTTANENNLCFGTYDLTVTDANGCTIDTLNFPINEPAPLTVDNINIVDELCPGTCDGTIDITATGATQFSIDGGATFLPAGSFTGLCSGSYDIVVEDATGCQGTDNAVVNSPLPVNAEFSFGPQPTTVLDPLIWFTNESENATTYLWDFGDGGTATTMDAVHEYDASTPGSYVVCLDVADANGCTDQHCETVYIDDIFSIYVPNAFTPNGDGINDFFLPILIAEDPTEFEFYIFNRWGELLFEAESSQTTGWDGTYNGVPVESEIYVWKVMAKDLYTGEEHEYIGHVGVVR